MNPIRHSIALSLLCAASTAQSPLLGETRRMLPTLPRDPIMADIGDLDGDGDRDVYFAAFANGQDEIWINTGAGVFVRAPELLPGDPGQGKVHLFDADGDGDLDVYRVSDTTSLPVGSLYENDGSGSMSDATLSWLGGVTEHLVPTFSRSSDLDQDGDLDLLLGNAGAGWMPVWSVLRNDGGSFAHVDPAMAESGNALDLELLDYDCDGRTDVLGAVFVGFVEQYRLWRNEGGLVFSDVSTTLPGIVDDGDLAETLDFDGDGDLDVYIGGGSTDALWRNDCGSFVDVSSQLPILPLGSAHTASVESGDVDADGDADLWLGNVSGLAYPVAEDSLWLNDGAGNFADHREQLPSFESGTHDVDLADLDGDGDLDALLQTFDGSRGMLNDGTGGFVDVTSPSMPPWVTSARAAAWGDVDGDGDADLYAGRGSDMLQNLLLLNDGAGRMIDVTETHLPIALDRTEEVALADLDGDGDLDAVVGNRVGAALVIQWNQGNGMFLQDEKTLGPLPSACEALVAADFFGAGRIDLLFGFASGKEMLFQNLGGGVFQEVDVQFSFIGTTKDLDAADLNLDGWNDGFRAGSGPDEVFLNAGDGSLVDYSGFVAPDSPNDKGSLVDLDLNGLTDIVVASVGLGSGKMWAHGPLLSFTDRSSEIAGSTGSQLGVLDVDRDGLKDLFFPGGLFLNQGGFKFTSGDHLLPEHVASPTSVSVVDADMNGGEDIFLSVGSGGDYQPQLLFNRAGQLSWGSVPRIAVPQILDLAGPPSTPWFLFVSIAPASIPLAPFGLLKLNPAPPAAQVAAGFFDGSGASKVSGILTTNPSLVGLSLYWQMLAGSPPTFSNLEITTLTDL